MALTSATACRIDLLRIPELWELGAGRRLLQLIAEHDMQSQLHLINLSQSRAELRIAGFLSQLMKRLSKLGFDARHIPTPMSRTDIANHLGLTLECLSRVLSRWRKAGVINSSRDHIEILQPQEIDTTAYHLAA